MNEFRLRKKFVLLRDLEKWKAIWKFLVLPEPIDFLSQRRIKHRSVEYLFFLINESNTADLVQYIETGNS